MDKKINQHSQKRKATTCACGEHAWVPLTRGFVTIIDVADAAWVSQWNWSALKRADNQIAVVRRENLRGNFFYLHRELANAPKGRVVDHWNNNSLDNRRGNLRACTNAQNVRNQRPQKKKTSSRFKGVYLDKSRGKWQAYINVGGSRTRLGRFESEIEAAMAYDAKAIELHGEFARTNASLGLFPESS
jgi:hypothetical protein